MEVTKRTPLKTIPVAGTKDAWGYRFTITLEDGSKRTLTGYALTGNLANNAALERWARISEHGYQEGM